MIRLDHFLPQIMRPSRYAGNEINAIRKDLDQVSVKVLLAFPDVYEVGMSHVGFQILYHILNGREDLAAERVFAPWVDMEAELRHRGIPLFSLESRCPASSFDIIGFSLQYELSYTNVLAMLDLARIPLRWEQRTREHPLVIAGGPCAFNPEPMAAFFDALVVGEGEEVISEIIEAYKQWRRAQADRAELLTMISAIPGVYVPARFSDSYHSDGSLKALEPLQPGYFRISKRVVHDLNDVDYPTRFIVPYTNIIHDRINIEIARGCSRGCRFCQAGMIYRPVRERSRTQVEMLAKNAQANTGWEELSLLSLSAGDYSEIEKLLLHLAATLPLRETALSFPSLRAETLNSALIDIVQQGRNTGFTIAPEAGTDRLRRVINKGLTESEIVETCRQVFAAGWKSIKLYFMVGLPTETDEDLQAIVDLAERIWAQGRGMKQKPQATVSVSTFIPKPHTPFQWASMIEPEEITRRQQLLATRLRRNKFRFKWHDALVSFLEGVMSRGDRRLAEVIEDAFHLGCRFDGWSDQFKPELWEQAFQGRAIDPHRYLQARNREDLLPWDHIHCGVEKEYLWEEHMRACREDVTPDCRFGHCNQCGVCDFASLSPRMTVPVLSEHPLVPTASIGSSSNAVKVRLEFSKTGKARFLSHLETVRIFARAARRAKIPVRYTEGFHPQPKITFGPALPVGMESLVECVDIELANGITAEEVKDQLNAELPQGFRVMSGGEIPLKTSAIADSIHEVSYRIRCNEEPVFGKYTFKEVEACIEGFLRCPTFPIPRIRKGSSITVDLRSAVKQVVFNEAREILFSVDASPGQSVRAAEVVAALFELSERECAKVSIAKIGMELKNYGPRSDH